MIRRQGYIALVTLSVLLLAPAGWSASAEKPATADAEQQKSYPSQASVAAKGEFTTITPTDQAVTKALDAKDLAGAKKLVSKPGAFRGTVSQVYTPDHHQITILDFSPNYHEALTAVLFPKDYSKFPDLEKLNGKDVLITGAFSSYRDQAQIELTNPAQIQVIRAPAADVKR